MGIVDDVSLTINPNPIVCNNNYVEYNVVIFF